MDRARERAVQGGLDLASDETILWSGDMNVHPDRGFLGTRRWIVITDRRVALFEASVLPMLLTGVPIFAMLVWLALHWQSNVMLVVAGLIGGLAGLAADRWIVTPRLHEVITPTTLRRAERIRGLTSAIDLHLPAERVLRLRRRGLATPPGTLGRLELALARLMAA